MKTKKENIDFVLAGATKAGTSALHEWFRGHPAIRLPRDKEPHYLSHGLFGQHYTGIGREITSLEAYWALFPENTAAQKKTGDFDPLTLHGPFAPDLLQAINPDAKALVILRNPVDRAYSHYLMEVRECFEARVFYQAIQEDYIEFNKNTGEFSPLIRLGFYTSQLEQFTRKLGRENVRVWLYDDFCEDPTKVVGEMCEFIGVESSGMPSPINVRENEAGVPKSRLSAAILRARRGRLRTTHFLYLKLPLWFRRYVRAKFLIKRVIPPPMPAAAKDFLIEVYKVEILKLEKLLGRNLAHWLRGPGDQPTLPAEVQKAKQALYFDEAISESFEIERPHGAGRLYEWSIKHKFNLALSQLSFSLQGQSLLEICCGSGMGSEIYANLGARVTGTDISERSIMRARERARKYGFMANFSVGDAENLPFPDQAFDIVAVHDGLHHLPNPLQAVREMCRVARRAVIIIEPARSWLTRQAVTAGIAMDYEDAGNYVYRFREDDVFPIARAAGFQKLRATQYLLYYQHEPFPWAKKIENTPLFYAFPLFFGLVGFVAPRLGNKICVVCERTR